MAVPTNTVQTFTLKGIRENLTDMIYRITPQDTPFMSSCGRDKATSTFHEWQTDALAAPDKTNAQVEGDDAVALPRTPTTRLGNFTQISRKAITVSGTAEAVNKAGRKSEMGLQAAKASAELKLDMEAILLSNQGASIGGAGTPRYLGSILSFIGYGNTGNVSYGATGANPAAPSPAAAGTRTDGTLRANSETLLKPVLQQLWQNGGHATDIFTSGTQKQNISTGFSGIAQRVNNVAQKAQSTIVAAADIYVSDFGNLKVQPARLVRSRDMFIFDFDLIDVVYLRPFFVKELAVTGDNTKKGMWVEYTLKVGNEQGLGLVTDLQ